MHIKIFSLPNGREPISEWLEKLDTRSRAKVSTFVQRLEAGGSVKNLRSLGSGVYELKIDFGPGYRVYFGKLTHTVSILLLGGDKQSQKRDIKKAKEYWRMIHAQI